MHQQRRARPRLEKLNRSGRRLLLAAVGLALVVRVAAVLATPHVALVSDPRDYDRHARSIAATGHYPPTTVAASGPTAIRPPAYPYLLGGVYALTGDSVRAGRLAQAVIGTVVVALVGLMALELFGVAAAVAATALAAIFPPLVIGGMTLLSEPLFVAFELAAVLAVLRWRRSPGTGQLVAAGILAGLALLTRSNALLVLLPLAFAVWHGRSWRSAALLLACAALVVAPWTIRNAAVFSSFVPVTDQDGVTLAGTYNATSRAQDGRWIVPTLDPAMAALYATYRHLPEPALSAHFGTAARRFAVDHPAYVVSAAVHNVPRLFNLSGIAFARTSAAASYGLGAPWAWLMMLGTIPVLLLAAAGVFTRAARAAPRWLWAIPVLLVSTVFVLAENRHRAGIDPFLLMLAGLALAAAWERLGKRPGRARPALA